MAGVQKPPPRPEFFFGRLPLDGCGTLKALYLILALIFAAATVWVYLGSVGSHFISDDWGILPTVTTFEGILSQFTGPYLGCIPYFYRPLTSAAQGLDLAVWGPSPLPFHVLNLVIFVACAAVAGSIAARFTPENPDRARLLAFVLCLLNPLAVGPAAWISNRGTIQCGLLVVTACYLTLRFAQEGKKRDLVLALGAHCLALLSKEDGILVPALAFLVCTSQGRWARALAAGGLFAVLDVAYLGFRSFLDLPMPTYHMDFLAHSGVIDFARRYLVLLSHLVLPQQNASPGLAVACAIPVVAGLGLLCLAGLRPFRARQTLGLLALVLVAAVPGTPFDASLAAASRIIFIALILFSALLGHLAARPPFFRRLPHAVILALLAAGMVPITLARIHQWKASGEISMQVVGAIHDLHRTSPPDEVFLFLDPPRHLDGVQVLDEGVQYILQPPYTRQSRTLIPVATALAREIINTPFKGTGKPPPVRVISWSPVEGLRHAPLPPFESSIWRSWRGEALKEWSPSSRQEGLVLRSPGLAISSLGMAGIEIRLRRDRGEIPISLSVRGPHAGGEPRRLRVRSLLLEGGERGIQIPLEFLKGWNRLGRIDEIGVVLEGVDEEDVSAISVFRKLPEVDVAGSITRMMAAGTPEEYRLRIRIHCPGSDIPWIRISFFKHRARAGQITVRGNALARGENGTRVLERRIPSGKLRSLGLLQVRDVFFQVEVLTDVESPMGLVARSSIVRLGAPVH